MVVLKKTGGISKSAHEAVCLQTDDQTYELRKRGSNPFEESPFIKWIGKEVIIEGKKREKIIFVEDICDCAEPDKDSG
ncbi:MAG: hypothetical protein ACXWV5_09965 [Flavitalea sp.]